MLQNVLPFFVVLAISLVIGWRFSKVSKNSNNYFLADRSLGWPLLMMTFVASQVGGGFILGTAEGAFEHGIFGIFYSIGTALGFLVLGLGFGAKLQSLQLNTTSDLFEKFYGSPFLKKIAALLSILTLTGILIAQAVALEKFMASLGWNEEWLFLVAWLAVIFYTTQGGFLAVVWTDLLQAVLMIGILLLAFFCTHSQAAMPTLSETLCKSIGQFDPTLLGLLVTPCLYMLIAQDMVQRCFAGISQIAVSKGALGASIILFVLAIIPVYFGMLGVHMGLPNDQSSKFMQVVALSTNNIIFSCAACAVFLAIIASASALLSAISCNIAHDFIGVSHPRAITFATGLVALGFSKLSSNIFEWMIASYELAVDSLFVPIIFAVFLEMRCRHLGPAANLATLFGCIGFIATKFISCGILGLFLPLMLSCLGFALGAIMLKKPSHINNTLIGDL